MILCDMALLIGIVMLLSLKLSLSGGFVLIMFTADVLIRCVKNHSAWYKLTGKAY